MPSKTPPTDLVIDPKLAEDIEISRREFAEGKGIPHAQVMRETRERLRDQIKMREDVEAGIKELDTEKGIPHDKVFKDLLELAR